MSAATEHQYKHGNASQANIFDYDAGLEDAARLSRLDENGSTNNPEPRTWTTTQPLDVDEEVVVTRRRQPIAKLDETRILSTAGIPRLRKNAKQMRYKGKGNEFSDMTKLLHMYQLWLDDLYPRAKFADGLTIIEKLGHKKTMQIHRRGWIDEGKPKPSYDEEETLGDEVGQIDSGPGTVTNADDATLQQRPQPQAHGEAPDEDELDALIAEEEQGTEAQPGTNRQGHEQLPDEDELDALMAEAQAQTVPRPVEDQRDPFADEEEAMAGMDW